MGDAGLSRAASRELDRRALEDYGLPGIVLMENAGRSAADEILAVLRERRAEGRSAERVLVACGPGNNGGDGCVAARHLANAGATVDLCATHPTAALRGDALVARRVVDRMRLAVHDVSDAAALERAEAAFERADVLVDALLGTGFEGQVRPVVARVIDRLNAHRERRGATLVALDLPSGLDCDTGEPSQPTIRADLTVSFAAPKIGFAAPRAAAYVGRVAVASIGVPAELLRGVRTLTRD
jgi:NAD(P)H-hydrate epimerase